jgi:multiple sugar transport system permease protein
VIPEAVNWTNEIRFALKVIMAMNIWSTAPFFMTLYLAALQDVPISLYEAAAVDGASGIKQFFHVTVPHMRPITAFVFVTSIIGTLQMFDQAYIMSNGSGGPSNATLTMALLIYQDAFGMQNAMGRASALALILAAVIFTFSMLRID